jgi:type IV pilus assembly protein PilN
MPRVNLLPWREAQRKQRLKYFGISAAGAVALGIAAVLLAHASVNRTIAYQEARNKYLEREIATLDKQIAEIKELEATKERLLARMQIIEQLQRSRPEVVHLFDELVRRLPDGVYLKSIKQTGNKLSIKGVAQSSTRVSAFMRNIDSSEWLTDPGLDVVETKEQGRARNSEFTIFASQVSHANPDGVEDTTTSVETTKPGATTKPTKPGAAAKPGAATKPGSAAKPGAATKAGEAGK